MNVKRIIDEVPLRIGQGAEYLRVHGPRALRAMRTGVWIGQMIEQGGGIKRVIKEQVVPFVLDIFEGEVEIEVKRRAPGSPGQRGAR